MAVPFFPTWLSQLLLGVLIGLIGLGGAAAAPTSLGRNRRLRFAFVAFMENLALFLVVHAIMSSHLYPTLQPLLFGLASILTLLQFVTSCWFIYVLRFSHLVP